MFLLKIIETVLKEAYSLAYVLLHYKAITANSAAICANTCAAALAVTLLVQRRSSYREISQNYVATMYNLYS